jgi:glucuronokinase
MIIRTHAYARAGLIGNPSDGYFGKTISIIIRNVLAEVTCYESPHVEIVPGARDHLSFESRQALVDDVRLNGYYGGVRLIKAAIVSFSDHCRKEGIPLDDRGFTMVYRTNIPVRVGLAGSSGIVTATIRALMAFYGVDIPQPHLPNLILRCETEELGIGAGLQDRVIQVYEGAVYMDFDRAFLEERGYGRYEYLEVAHLPPLFVAYHDHLSEGTEITHNDLRGRFNRGEPAVVEGMKTFAGFAEEARRLIDAGRGREIGPLMDANFDLRASLCRISEGNFALVRTGRALGAHTKFAGSGGAVVGAYDGDPDRLARLRSAYEAFGARLFVPIIEPTSEEHLS